MFDKKNFLTIAALAFLGLGMAACETVGGAGQDIQSAGEAIQDASN
jgi:predicted small secreted protein